MLWGKRRPEPTDIHPARKKAKPSEAVKPTIPVEPPTEKKQQPNVKAEDAASNLSHEDLEALREDAFVEMHIPFAEVLKLESLETENGRKLIARPIDPREFKEEAKDIQNRFAQLGFAFMPTYYEIFISHLLFINQEEKRRLARENGQPLPPYWDLAHIIVWRQAERQVKEEIQIATDGKLSAKEDNQTLTKKIHQLTKEMWQQGEAKMLRRQAERRLRRERQLRGDTPLEESDVQAIIQKITTERQTKRDR